MMPVLSMYSSPLEILNWRKEKGEGISLHPVKYNAYLVLTKQHFL